MLRQSLALKSKQQRTQKNWKEDSDYLVGVALLDGLHSRSIMFDNPQPTEIEFLRAVFGPDHVPSGPSESAGWAPAIHST